MSKIVGLTLGFITLFAISALLLWGNINLIMNNALPYAKKLSTLKPKTKRYFLEKNLITPASIGPISNQMDVTMKEVEDNRAKIESIYCHIDSAKTDTTNEYCNVSLYYFMRDGAVFHVYTKYTLEDYRCKSNRITGNYLEVNWEPWEWPWSFTINFLLMIIFIVVACCTVACFRELKDSIVKARSTAASQQTT